jgi:integral membrane protein (TIGR00529 family)
MSPLEIVVETGRGLVNLDSVMLAAVLFLVMFFGYVLKEVERIDQMLAALQDLIPSVRLNMALAPAAIGLLPMPGGALLSAPMVGGLAEKNEIELAPEEATVINYWFRHVWEYCLPIYPSVVLITYLLQERATNIELRDVALLNLPLAVFCVLVGAAVYYRLIPADKGTRKKSSNRMNDFKQLVQSFWPVAAVVVGASLGSRLMLIAFLAATSVLLIIIHRPPKENALNVVKTTFSVKMVLLILGVIIFKHAVEQSGCVPAILDAFRQLGLPPAALLFSIPFIVGFMTGLSVSFVSVAVPILLPLLVLDIDGQQTAILSRAMILYAGGYYGVLVSPVHFCLILSKEHFGADLSKVYRLMLPGIAILAALATAYYFVLKSAGM